MQQPNQSAQAQPSANQIMAQVRQVAQSKLSPQELGVLQQSVTPELVQVLAKLYGDRAIMLVAPLVNIQQTEAQPQQQPAQAALNQFQAQPMQRQGVR